MLLLLNKFRSEKHMGVREEKNEIAQKMQKKIKKAALCNTFILYGCSKTITSSSNSNNSSSSNNNNNNNNKF